MNSSLKPCKKVQDHEWRCPHGLIKCTEGYMRNEKFHPMCFEKGRMRYLEDHEQNIDPICIWMETLHPMCSVNDQNY